MADAWLVTLVSLHVLGAALWVGGQLALAPATRVLRGDRERLRAVANAAQPVLWSGLVLAAATGALVALVAAAGAALHVVAGRRRMSPGLVGAGAGLALAAGLALVVMGAMLRFA